MVNCPATGGVSAFFSTRSSALVSDGDSRFQKLLHQIGGNDDALVFEYRTEFFWRVAFPQGFTEIFSRNSAPSSHVFRLSFSGKSESSVCALTSCSGRSFPAFACLFLLIQIFCRQHIRKFSIYTIAPLHDAGSSWHDGSCLTPPTPSCRGQASGSSDRDHHATVTPKSSLGFPVCL